MPRHFEQTPVLRRRWVGVLSIALVAALLLTLGWIFIAGGAGTPVGAPAQESSMAASSATPAPSPTPGTAQATSPTPGPVPPSSTSAEAAEQPTNPVTGRVDSLDGLVPDYKLPPIVDGLAPVLTRVPTEQKVVFVTIDDGAVKRESDLALLEKHGIKASLFLAHDFIAADPDFYLKYTKAGHLIENHTMTHNLDFIHLSYEQQKAEICGMADMAEQKYGRRPVFFRPPGGPYTQSVQRAVADCGLKAIVDWETKANAGRMDYQVGAGLRPGDIVLMHFRPEFPNDLAAFLAAQKAAGLKVVLLEDYLMQP